MEDIIKTLITLLFLGLAIYVEIIGSRNIYKAYKQKNKVALTVYVFSFIMFNVIVITTLT